MKGLSNMITGLSTKAKIMLLAGGVIGTTAVVPVAYVVSHAAEETKEIVSEASADIIGDVESAIPDDFAPEEEDSGVVMQEDFFGSGTNNENEEVAEVKNRYSNPYLSEATYKQDPGEFAGSNGVRKESIFSESRSPTTLAEEQKPEAAAKTAISNAQNIPTFKSKYSSRGKGETKYINHDEEEADDVAELLADKDYPSTIASNPHDLSRILTTDSFIPAVMYTALNSEIPSKTVLAVVESDVVGFHGDNILIPKGSKVEGTYEAIANKHARRMQITWFKITRPDGVIIKLDAESGDMQGAGGVSGYLDQRLKDRYGAALLLSTINAMAQMSVRENDIRQLAAVESYGRETGTLTAQVIRENINAMPIIMIRQGTRFNIRPYQNIYFPKPKNKAVKALFINTNQ